MSVLVDSAFAVPSEVKDLPTAVSLITRITGEDHNVVLPMPQSQKLFAGSRARPMTKHRTHQVAEPAGYHFKKSRSVLSGARSGGAGGGTVGMEDVGQSGIGACV